MSTIIAIATRRARPLAVPVLAIAVAGALLLVAPGIVGFGASVGAAFAWCWWLDREERGATMRVLVPMSSTVLTDVALLAAAALAVQAHGKIVAVCLLGPDASNDPDANSVLHSNLGLARELGATVVTIQEDDFAEGLIAVSEREQITHAVLPYDGPLPDLFSPTSLVGALIRASQGLEIHVVSASAAAQARSVTAASSAGKRPTHATSERLLNLPLITSSTVTLQRPR